MRVYWNGRTYELRGSIRVKELLKRLNLSEAEVLVIDRKEMVLLTPDVQVEEGAELEIRRVVSGGKR